VEADCQCEVFCMSTYGLLRGSSIVMFPWKSIWGVKIPEKVVFSILTTAQGKVLIVD
jgi:hypothetical protein